MEIQTINKKRYVKCFYTQKEKEYLKSIELPPKEDFYFIELKVYNQLNKPIERLK